MLNNAVIYDESNSSIETEVHRQLEISEEEWAPKKRVLQTLMSKTKLKGRFVKCECTVENRQLYGVSLMTKDGASLHLQLSKYGNGSCYLGTRGSPTKLLTGQNLVELRDHEEIERTMARIGCTRFEAMSIVGFMLAFVAAKANGCILFTEEERKKIRDREIGVYSIGFATYMDFGVERDARLHWLAYLANSTVNMCGDTWSMGEFMGVQVEVWRTDLGTREKGWNGRCTGVLLKRSDSRHTQYSQLIYLKEAEIEAKKHGSGSGNYDQIGKLTTVDRKSLGDRLVRIDNVFYRNYITAWLNAAGIQVGVAGKPTIKECASLFDDTALVRRMCAAMSVELGIRTLVGAPSSREIEIIKSRATGLEAAILAKWSTTKVTVEQGRLEWELPYTKSTNDQEVVKTLNQKYYLDLSLPIDFYVHLDRIRQEFFYTTDDAAAMSYEAIGYTGSLVSHLEAPSAIRKRVRDEVRAMVRDARQSIALPAPKSKRLTLNN